MIREPVRGYGRSYKRGFRSATCDLIVTLDGDHSYPPDAISYLIEAFLHLDVDFLNASRFPVRDRRAMSFKHKFGNWVLSLAMSHAVLSLGARFAIRHVGVSPIDSGGHEAGIGRHGILGGDKDRSAQERAGPFRGDLDPVLVAAGRNQAEPMAGRHLQFVVPGTEALYRPGGKVIRRVP